jgi:hypothetical protein
MNHRYSSFKEKRSLFEFVEMHGYKDLNRRALQFKLTVKIGAGQTAYLIRGFYHYHLFIENCWTNALS